MKKIILSVKGMTCSACSNGLEKFLNKQNGVYSAAVNLVLAAASIEYDEALLDIKKIEGFIKRAGFESGGIFSEMCEEEQKKSKLVMLIIFGVFAVFMMYISMGHMISLPTPKLLDIGINPRAYAISLAVLSSAFLIYGFDIMKSGYKNAVHLTPNMDTLVMLSVICSYAYSIYGTVKIFTDVPSLYVGELYFESAACVIFFVKLGRYIDGINRKKTQSALRRLVKITPDYAVLKTEDGEEKITLDRISKGDILICRAGEKIAADGVISFGEAHFDESFISGESRPQRKSAGDSVLAGSINYDGYTEYRAERIGKDSTVSEIVRLVGEASGQKAPIAKIADTVSGYFVPFVILAALVCFAVYVLIGKGFSYALRSFVTVLVAACPCSLGLATPLAVVIGEGFCAEHGILVKKGSVLENAKKVGTVVFDKTGTLTYGKPKVAEIINYTDTDTDILMSRLCGLEAQSSHPISRAFSDYANGKELTPTVPQSFENIAGCGIYGISDGEKIVIGNEKMLAEHGIENTRKADADALASGQCTVIYAAISSKLAAVIGVKDTLRDDAQKLIGKLKSEGITTVMLTGDGEEVAFDTAKILGIDKTLANVLPADKKNAIADMSAEKNGLLMFCGDGINDSPALAAADISVSLAGSTDIAMDTADVILNCGLCGIADIMDISRAAVRNIKQNLFWAFFYNILMIPVAAGVFSGLGIVMTPMTAALAMTLSSLTVVLNALRLRNIKSE